MHEPESKLGRRLIILTQYYPPEMGAPQSRLFELAVGLQKFGWDIKVVTALPNYPTGAIFKAYKGKFCTKELRDGISISRYWIFPSNSARLLPRLVSMVSFSLTSLFSLPTVRRFRSDFVFVESPPLTLALSGLVIAKITGAKLIMNVSDLWPLSAKELGAIGNGFVYRRLEALEKFLYQAAFICTGQSQEIVDYIKEKLGQRVFLFRNGVDSKRFRLKRPHKRKNVPRLVYAGLLGVAQDILTICKNVDFGRLGVEFHIYGSGGQREKILKFVEENPNSGVFLHPPVDREDVPTILSEYDGALIPLARKIYGAVPSKIYEAMAAGLPIIFSGEGEGAQIIRDTKVGWVSEPGAFVQLQRNISEFADDTRKRVMFSANGIRSAAEVFDRSKQIQMLDIFLRSPKGD